MSALGYYKGETFFDEEITVNPMCVIRVLGSIHSKSGYITCKINPALLRRSMEHILTHIPKIGKVRLGIPIKGEMTQDGANALPSPRLEQMGKDVASLASLPTSSIRYFITNRVLGIRRSFVPVFIYQKSQTYHEKELKRLQNKFNLGNIYIYETKKHYVALALKTMQRRQLQKVLNQSSSKTKHDFKKYQRIFIPFHMGFEVKLPGKYTGHLSRGHLRYVEPMKPDNNRYCGWDKIELIKSKKV